MAKNPIDITFQYLAGARTNNSIDLLVHAIQSDSEVIRAAAGKAMITRPSTRCKVEAIRYLDRMPESATECFKGRSLDFKNALTQALGHGDDQVKQNALEVIRLSEDFSQVGLLVKTLDSENQTLADGAEETLEHLVNRIYEYSKFGKSDSAVDTFLRDAPKIQYQMIKQFEESCDKIDEIKRPEIIVESILILGDIRNSTVNRILTQTSAKLGDIISNAINESKHEGIMSLIVEFLSQKFPYYHAMSALQHRTDPEFISQLLRTLPKNMSQSLRKNLKLVDQVDWLIPTEPKIDLVPPSLQPALVNFIQALGISFDEKTMLQQWILQNGSTEGREAASTQMSKVDPQQLKNIVLNGLESEEEGVKAWATSQLRKTQVPEAISLLLARIDSPEEEVQNAARTELSGFDIERTLDVGEFADESICEKLGAMVLKVNPDVLIEFSREMSVPIRTRRVRAAKVAHKMNLHEELIPALFTLMHDSDAYARRVAIEILQTIHHPQVIAEVQNMLDDPSNRVKEAAQEALKIMEKRFEDAEA